MPNLINNAFSITPDLIKVSVTGNNGQYKSGAVYWDGNSQQFKVIDPSGSVDMFTTTMQIEAGDFFKEMFIWYLAQKSEKEKLKLLREKYPNLDEAYLEYKALLALFED